MIAERAVYPVPDPGAASWSYTVPAGPPRRLVAVNVMCTTDATVGDRCLRLIITNKSGTTVCSCLAQLTQQASVTDGRYCWAPGLQSNVVNSPVNCCIPPDVTLEEGDVITMDDRFAISAGDRLTGSSVVCGLEPVSAGRH